MRHPPFNGRGLGTTDFPREKRRGCTKITEQQRVARRENIAKARAVRRAMYGSRAPWWQRPYPPPNKRCKAKCKRTGGRCKNWGLEKPDGARFPTCRYHGSHLPRGALERKKINDRVLSPRQWQRYKRKWREAGEAFDREQEQAPPLKPLYPA
jgi:hypothetical protein